MIKGWIDKGITLLITLSGCALLIKGDLTNGLLALILGEILDLPRRVREDGKKQD